MNISKERLTHLKQLEAESMHIMREVIAEFQNPAMLYSVGKDSSVMLHILQKAFYPASPPLPLVHVDTTWKFKEMIEFRDRRAKEVGMELLVYSNPKGLEMDISPFTHGSAVHTDIMKTEGLKNMLNMQKYDAVFGGARRDEEKSRAKERIYSFRDENHRWDPKNQRPELWNLFNGRKNMGEHFRIFPISNWTEMDVWQYILHENIDLPSLYFSHKREVINRNGVLLGKCDFIELRDNEKWKEIHMMPHETVQAHLDLKGKQLFPVHNGTFDLSIHAWDEPFERVSEEANKKRVTVNFSKMGEPISLISQNSTTLWWK